MLSRALDRIDIWHFTFLGKHFNFSFSNALSKEEKEKAASFHYSIDAEKYVFCRGMLRRLISHYTGLSQENVVISYNQYGKPHLLNDVSLRFNLSHTSDSAVFALGYDTEIGIDLEKLEPILESLEIAQEFFTKEEQVFLHKLPKEERIKGFYRFWTKREALLKGLGFGFGEPGLEILTRIQLVEDDHYIQNDQWHVQELICSNNHVGALAYSGLKRKIVYHPSEIINVDNS